MHVGAWLFDSNMMGPCVPGFPYSMGGCQNNDPSWGTLNIRCRILIGVQKGTMILTLRDPPRPGPAHPREHGDSAQRPSRWTPSKRVGFRV